MYNNLDVLSPNKKYIGEDLEKDYHIAMAMLKSCAIQTGKHKAYIAELEDTIEKLKSKTIK